MPAQKDFKRVIRSRMEKTGESYTAARSQLMKTRSRAAAQPRSATPPPAPPPDYATLAGMSDEKLKAATGCNWERWVWALDRVEAHAWPHARIAEYVHEKYKVRDWWTQTVAVGYERIKGLRAIGQRRDGSYEATRSRTFGVTLARLYNAWASARARGAWLEADGMTAGKGTKNKYLHFKWKDGTPVDLGFLPTKGGKSQVAVTHRKLPSKAAAEEKKAYWTAQLGRLAAHLQK